MDRESREGRRPDDGDEADDFRLAWGEADEDTSARSRTAKPVSDEVPWDELADDSSPQFEEASFRASGSRLVPDDDEDESGPQPDDESPPHGDPLDTKADEVFEPDRPPASRMDSLQDALASIRERVQSLSDTGRPGAAGPARASELTLYRAATDDRTLAELRRHSRETEDLLRRMSGLMQDLSLDLRSIVDAARRAIDQTSEQAESSIELGRLLGERIEQMDEQIAARVDTLEEALAKRVDQMDAAIGSVQVHLDKRLTKIEQRSGVGVVREEMAEVRADIGDLRTELGSVRDEVGAIGDLRTELGSVRDEVGAIGTGGNVDLEQRLDVVGTQLDRTLTILRDVVEGAPGDDVDMVDGVVAAIRTETEAAVEPFRLEVEELGRQLGEALDREEQLGTTLTTLTEEVQRLRKRIAVRAAPPTIDDDQIQTIVQAVVDALPAGGGQPAAARRRRTPEPRPEPDFEFEFESELEAEPEPEPEPKPPRRRRSTRAKKAVAPEPEPDYEVDINEPFAPGELEIDEPGVEPDEEPIRRARGSGRKASRPVKSKRTRSSSR